MFELKISLYPAIAFQISFLLIVRITIFNSITKYFNHQMQIIIFFMNLVGRLSILEILVL